MSFSSKKHIIYNNIHDVHDELLKLKDISIEKGFEVGEALYTQSLHFADLSRLVKIEFQDLIKKYQFCKLFNSLPYPSYEDTPEEVVDVFMTIHKEVEHYGRAKSEKKDKGSD